MSIHITGFTNPYNNTIQNTSFDLANMKKHALKFAKDYYVKEGGEDEFNKGLFEYIELILTNRNFQDNPLQYLKNWESNQTEAKNQWAKDEAYKFFHHHFLRK